MRRYALCDCRNKWFQSFVLTRVARLSSAIPGLKSSGDAVLKN